MSADVFFCLWLAVSVVVLLRNQMVYRARTAILHTPGHAGLDLHNRLPSYNEMLFHPAFWLKWTEADWREYLESRSTS